MIQEINSSCGAESWLKHTLNLSEVLGVLAFESCAKKCQDLRKNFLKKSFGIIKIFSVYPSFSKTFRSVVKSDNAGQSMHVLSAM